MKLFYTAVILIAFYIGLQLVRENNKKPFEPTESTYHMSDGIDVNKMAKWYPGQKFYTPNNNESYILEVSGYAAKSDGLISKDYLDFYITCSDSDIEYDAYPNGFIPIVYVKTKKYGCMKSMKNVGTLTMDGGGSVYLFNISAYQCDDVQVATCLMLGQKTNDPFTGSVQESFTVAKMLLANKKWTSLAWYPEQETYYFKPTDALASDAFKIAFKNMQKLPAAGTSLSNVDYAK